MWLESICIHEQRLLRREQLTHNNTLVLRTVHMLVTHDTSSVSRDRLTTPLFRDRPPRPCQRR
jgi:hypothetical protein